MLIRGSNSATREIDFPESVNAKIYSMNRRIGDMNRQSRREKAKKNESLLEIRFLSLKGLHFIPPREFSAYSFSRSFSKAYWPY